MLPSAWDIVKKSVDLFYGNWRKLFGYAKRLFAPVFLLLSAQIAVSQSAPGLSNLPGATLTTLTIMFVVGIAVAIYYMWVSLAAIRSISDIYDNRPPKTAKEEVKTTKSLLAPFIIASILASLAILGGFVLLIIPGIIFSIWFAFIPQAVALDGKKNIDALSHSRQVVKGRWWGVFWRLVVSGIIISFLVSAAQWMFEAPFALLLGVPNDAITITELFVLGARALVGAAVYSFLTPLAITAPVIIYKELHKTIMPVPPAAPGNA